MRIGSGIPAQGNDEGHRIGKAAGTMDSPMRARTENDRPRKAATSTLVSDTACVTADASDILRQSRIADPPRLLPGMSTLRLLIVDDDEHVLRAICEIAASMGFAVHAARTPKAAADLLERHNPDVVLLDLLPHDQGFSFLQMVKQTYPRVPIIVMTAFATVNSAVDAMRMGASDYLTKPFAMDELTGTLELAAQRCQFDVESRRLQDRLLSDAGGHGLIGASAAMEKLLRMVAKVAPATHPVLIMGESGTGKELVARLINATGNVQGLPMMSIDCSALSPALLETELFGYVKHEGTAEREERQGLLTLVGGGTLFIREIAAMPLDLQARLQRALQERKVRPAGAAVAQAVTIRLLAASSRNLPQLVESGEFRKDLYFRLNVVHLRVPPLRERKDDIPLLAAYFLRRHAEERNVEYRLDGEVLRVLEGYDWPGNVRELEGSLERACSFASSSTIFLPDFPSQLRGYRRQLEVETLRVDTRLPTVQKLPHSFASAPSGPHAIVSIAELEKQAILLAIRSLNGDKLMAAKLLGIGKTTLYRKLKEYGIDEESLDAS